MLPCNEHMPLMSPLPSPMNCPHCGAKYDVVRIEVATPSEYGELTCLNCGGPLPAREGSFVMKYFLVDRPRHRQRPARSVR
jgi:transcription elongation factor Elf1